MYQQLQQKVKCCLTHEPQLFAETCLMVDIFLLIKIFEAVIELK